MVGPGRARCDSPLRLEVCVWSCLQGEELVSASSQSPDTLIGERNPSVPDTSF